MGKDTELRMERECKRLKSKLDEAMDKQAYLANEKKRIESTIEEQRSENRSIEDLVGPAGAAGQAGGCQEGARVQARLVPRPVPLVSERFGSVPSFPSFPASPGDAGVV